MIRKEWAGGTAPLYSVGHWQEGYKIGGNAWLRSLSVQRAPLIWKSQGAASTDCLQFPAQRRGGLSSSRHLSSLLSGGMRRSSGGGMAWGGHGQGLSATQWLPFLAFLWGFPISDTPTRGWEGVGLSPLPPLIHSEHRVLQRLSPSMGKCLDLRNCPDQAWRRMGAWGRGGTEAGFSTGTPG